MITISISQGSSFDPFPIGIFVGKRVKNRKMDGTHLFLEESPHFFFRDILLMHTYAVVQETRLKNKARPSNGRWPVGTRFRGLAVGCAPNKIEFPNLECATYTVTGSNFMFASPIRQAAVTRRQTETRSHGPL